MSAAVITILVLLVIIAMLVFGWVVSSRIQAKEHQQRIEAMHRSHQLAAEQSRAHARADERQWADDEPARIWRNK